ncbi:sugar-binding protein [Paenibacillus shunpengii]|uniref:Sugar-binding protein n=1 Tax=Paenibacillus shunpengii TaxID=2054424 RepID=A0ABW5SM28_9BACL
MKRIVGQILIFALFISSFYSAVPAEKVFADSGSKRYEAEAAILENASVTDAVYVDMSNEASSITWDTVSASVYANYNLNIKYSSSASGIVKLHVNGQEVASFTTGQEGTQENSVWSDLNAIVTLHPGTNVILLTSEGKGGPLVDYLDVTPFTKFIEGESGHGTTHVNHTFGANTAAAPGFSGTGYVIIPGGRTPPAYLLWDNISIAETGSYTLKFRYNNADNGARPVNLKVNDVEVPGFTGASTGAWSNWQLQEIKNVTLNAGTNSIKIEPKLTAAGLTAAMPNIDRIEIHPESIPVIGDQIFRTTTFEADDVDPVIAATPVGANLVTPLLDGKPVDPSSNTAVTLTEENGNRMAQVTIPARSTGTIGFPFHSSWTTPVSMNSYTIEANLMFKDQKANYLFNLVNGSDSLHNPMLVFGMDGKMYARSDNSANGALAARTDWEINTSYKIKMIAHVDTKSYDLYLNDTQIVNNEPMKNENYSSGLKAFYLQVKDGPHEETAVIVDNIKLSGSNEAGSAPVVNPNPGEYYIDFPYIGEPVDYYVSPSGLDTNDGLTPETAFKNIQTAAALTNPGDTVYIMPGTYTASNTSYGSEWLKITRSGAKNKNTGETAYITYKAYDFNNKPKLKLADNVPGIWNMVDIQANYIIIDGLEVEGNNMNISLEQAEANYEHKIAGGSNWAEYAKTNTNGINVKGHHIIVKNSYVHHMAGGGIGGAGDYMWFDHNISHSNSWYSMHATSGMGSINNVSFDDNTADYKIIMSNNIIYDNEAKVKWEKTKGYSDGNGIIFDVDDGYYGKKLAFNNIVYNNGGGGIHIYRSNNVHVINNTIYHNSRSPHLKYPNMDAQSSDNSILINNISIARDEEGEYANLNSGWNNMFANNIYGGNVRFLDQNEQVINPKFVNVSQANGSFDFTLQADSPAIDTGTREIFSKLPRIAEGFGDEVGIDSPFSKDFLGNDRPYAGVGSNNRIDIGAYETEYNNPEYLVDDSIEFKTPIPDEILKAKASKGTPELDGEIDEIWSTTESFQAMKISDPTKAAPMATMRLLWDEHNLYVLAEVEDDNLSVRGANLWEHDSMEFFMDENNGNSTAFQLDDGHYRVNYENLRTGGSRGKGINASSFSSAAKVVDGGYIIEAKLPLTTITGSVGKVIGFDAGASDDNNDDGIRDNATMWSNQRFNSHESTEWYGDVTFVEAGDLPTTPGPAPTPVVEGSMIQLTPTLTGNTAKAELSQELLDDLLKQAESDARGEKNVRIKLNPIANAKSYSQSLPAQMFKEGDGKISLTVQSELGTITLSNDMLKANDLADASSVQIVITATDTSGLKQELKERIGSKPVLDLSVRVDGQLIAWKNNKSPVTVSVDYEPTAEELEKPENIFVWYIDAKGKVVKLPSGKYDTASGKVTFTTSHFSLFAVAY